MSWRRLGLPMSRPGAAWATAGVLGLVYALTMARSLTFYDSPELALVAHQLGVGHPIGQPTHSLIGFPFAHIPGVSTHVGLTLMSALFGALCVLPAWSLSERLVPAKEGRLDAAVRGSALLGVGLSLVAWEPATRVEVYTLAAFGALWATARLVARGPRWESGLALGLAAGAHAVIAAAQGLGLLAVVAAWVMKPRRAANGPDEEADEPKRPSALPFFGAGLAGLLVFAYVPLAASRHPDTLAWGAPNDGARLLAYLRGADYQHNQGIGIDALFAHFGELVAWGARHGTLVVGVAGLLGLLALSSRARGPARALRWTALVVCLLDIGFVAANVVFHPDVPDYRGYFLSPLWLAGAGMAALGARLAAEEGRLRIYGAVLAAVPALALIPSAGHLAGPRDTPSLAERIGSGALVESQRGAILIVEADHWVAPMLYLQEVEQERADVVVVALGLSSSSWFWEHTFARHPGLNTMALEGPGGRAGRVRRLLEANPDRPVQVESFRIAQALGLEVCGVGWSLHTRCEPGFPTPMSATSEVVDGAPYRGESREVAARVGEARGEMLWRLGYGDAAARAWLAGVGSVPSGLPERGPPLSGPLPDWTQPAALHDPARNFALAGLLLHALGRRAEALGFVDRAMRDGLHQASAARQQIMGGR